MSDVEDPAESSLAVLRLIGDRLVVLRREFEQLDREQPKRWLRVLREAEWLTRLRTQEKQIEVVHAAASGGVGLDAARLLAEVAELRSLRVRAQRTSVT